MISCLKPIQHQVWSQSTLPWRNIWNPKVTQTTWWASGILDRARWAPWTFIPLFAQVLLIIPGFLFNLFLCRRSTTRWEEALTHSTASLARVSTTGQNNKEAAGKVSKYVKLVFLRFDWWRGWDPDYENKTHSTDLLNVEAVRVVQVKEKSQMTFEISKRKARWHLKYHSKTFVRNMQIIKVEL